MKPTTLTSTSQNQQQQTGTSSQQQSTETTLSPEMQELMRQLMAYGQQSMQNPMQAMAPIRNAGMQGINATYAQVPNQLSSQMARRGYGSSGTMGNAMLSSNLARANAMSGLEGQLATQGIQQQQYGASLGENILNAMRGTTTSSTGTTSMSGTSSGTQTQPGPSLFSQILGGAATVAGAMTGMGWKPFGSGGSSGGGGTGNI